MLITSIHLFSSLCSSKQCRTWRWSPKQNKWPVSEQMHKSKSPSVDDILGGLKISTYELKTSAVWTLAVNTWLMGSGCSCYDLKHPPGRRLTKDTCGRNGFHLFLSTPGDVNMLLWLQWAAVIHFGVRQSEITEHAWARYLADQLCQSCTQKEMTKILKIIKICKTQKVDLKYNNSSPVRW